MSEEKKDKKKKKAAIIAGIVGSATLIGGVIGGTIAAISETESKVEEENEGEEEKKQNRKKKTKPVVQTQKPINTRQELSTVLIQTDLETIATNGALQPTEDMIKAKLPENIKNEVNISINSKNNKATITPISNSTKYKGNPVTISYTLDKTLTQQDTIYIDNNGKQITTSEQDLSDFESKEIIQIGFYKNEQGEIQVVKMPKTIEKVPNELPREITSLEDMFYYATSFNQDISKWNVSNVTDMKGMFYHATSFNQDISKWNVSNVTDMKGMFEYATSFNQDISKWNVSNVTDMKGMFYYAISFNQDISKWNVSNVTDMTGMFASALVFNQDISKWNVSNVTEYINFANNSNINNDENKLPKWKYLMV